MKRIWKEVMVTYQGIILAFAWRDYENHKKLS
jgi:hypothetical protein